MTNTRGGPELSTDAAAIEQHYTGHWGAPTQRHRLNAGPIHQLAATFEVLVFNRTNATSYATRSMSEPGDSERIELHLLTGAEQPFRPELVELLTTVAHFHRTGQRLGLGHSVNFGRPWLEGATASFGMVSLPFLDGPGFEWMNAPRVRFLWLIPITESEREFKRARGTEALERRFEESQFDYLDPRRRSVV